MARQFKPGDRVEWNTPQGKIRGKVKKKLTRPRKIKAHAVRASAHNPEYLVTSEKTGKAAAHRPAQLKKLATKRSAQPRRRQPK